MQFLFDSPLKVGSGEILMKTDHLGFFAIMCMSSVFQDKIWVGGRFGGAFCEHVWSSWKMVNQTHVVTDSWLSLVKVWEWGLLPGAPGGLAMGGGLCCPPPQHPRQYFRHSWRRRSVVHWSCAAKHSGSASRPPGFTPYLPFYHTVVFNVGCCSLWLTHTSQKPSLLFGSCMEEKTYLLVVSNDITKSK